MLSANQSPEQYTHNPAAYSYVELIEATNIPVEDVVALVKQGSEKGFNLLYDKFYQAIFIAIKTIVVQTSVTEDLLQETFIKIWKNIHQYNPQKGSFYTWLIKIARHTAIDYVRSKEYNNQRKNLPEEVLFTNNCPAQLAEQKYADDGLRFAVKKLDPKYSEVIDLIYFYGYTYDQAAKYLNMPPGTIKTRARKAMLLLKKYIE